MGIFRVKGFVSKNIGVWIGDEYQVIETSHGLRIELGVCVINANSILIVMEGVESWVT